MIPLTVLILSRTPRGVRELKLVMLEGRFGKTGRTPRGVRELKFFSLQKGPMFQVALRVGCVS